MNCLVKSSALVAAPALSWSKVCFQLFGVWCFCCSPFPACSIWDWNRNECHWRLGTTWINNTCTCWGVPPPIPPMDWPMFWVALAALAWGSQYSLFPLLRGGPFGCPCGLGFVTGAAADLKLLCSKKTTTVGFQCLIKNCQVNSIVTLLVSKHKQETSTYILM